MKIYNECCLETLRNNRVQGIDCVVMSPPYNIGLSYDIYSDKRSSDEYVDWIVSIFRELHRCLNDDGSVFLNIDRSSKNPGALFKLIGELCSIFCLQNTISWVKSISIDDVTKGHFKPLNSKRYLNHTHEYIYHFTKSGNIPLDKLSIGVPYMYKDNIKRFNIANDRRCGGDTWFIPYETSNGNRNHPGAFPLELPLRCIKLTGLPSKGCGFVYDPFLGSGTTMVAAQLLGLDCAGSEISETYIDIARKRLKEGALGCHPIHLGAPIL